MAHIHGDPFTSCPRTEVGTVRVQWNHPKEGISTHAAMSTPVKWYILSLLLLAHLIPACEHHARLASCC